MLVSTHPSALGAPTQAPAFRRACLLSLGAHALMLGLIAYTGGLARWPDGGVPPRLQVRIESRPTPAPLGTEPDTLTSGPDDGARADGQNHTGDIVATPPEPLGEMPLFIEGAPGAARLHVEVDANGKVTAIRVENSTLSPVTEQEMIERLRAVRFRPGTEKGKPASSRLVLEVRVESPER